MHKIQSSRLSWLWGTKGLSVKDETTLLPSVPLSHSCVFDIGHKSLSAAYARVLHDKFRRLQIRLLSGASLDTSCEDMELFLGEAGSTDLEMQTLMSLFDIRLRLLKRARDPSL